MPPDAPCDNCRNIRPLKKMRLGDEQTLRSVRLCRQCRAPIEDIFEHLEDRNARGRASMKVTPLEDLEPPPAP